jgi:hypothetical protein
MKTAEDAKDAKENTEKSGCPNKLVLLVVGGILSAQPHLSI